MIPFVDANVIVKAFTENVCREKCRKILSKEFLTNTLCLVEAMKIISLIIHDKVEAAACIKSVYKKRVKINSACSASCRTSAPSTFPPSIEKGVPFEKRTLFADLPESFGFSPVQRDSTFGTLGLRPYRGNLHRAGARFRVGIRAV